MDIDALDIRNFDQDTVEVLLQKLNARMDEMNLATSESEVVSEEGSVRGHSVYHVSSNSSRPAFLESIGLLSSL
jgi:hypothetical protein